MAQGRLLLFFSSFSCFHVSMMMFTATNLFPLCLPWKGLSRYSSAVPCSVLSLVYCFEWPCAREPELPLTSFYGHASENIFFLATETEREQPSPRCTDWSSFYDLWPVICLCVYAYMSFCLGVVIALLGCPSACHCLSRICVCSVSLCLCVSVLLFIDSCVAIF